jgi:hypothetical protein
MRQSRHHTIAGDEKARFLNALDCSLACLVTALQAGKDWELSDALFSFGSKNQWDWSRLPTEIQDSSKLATLVQKAREFYTLFDWHEDKANPLNSRGYYTELGISTETGLPWAWDFIRLHTIKNNLSFHLLQTMPYEQGVMQLAELLTGDLRTPDEARLQVVGLHEGAMKRNFLEMLKENPLMSKSIEGYAYGPVVEKLVSLGAETCYSVSLLLYSRASGTFQAYVLELWQDILKPHIIETPEGFQLSSAFKDALWFAEQNAPWFILSSIDKRFESLHPVHVSRAIIGPYENRYMAAPELAKQLLIKAPDTALLRARMEYSYSPNHTENSECQLQQVLYRESWYDEIIVAPAGHAASIASSVLGDRVRVVKC